MVKLIQLSTPPELLGLADAAVADPRWLCDLHASPGIFLNQLVDRLVRGVGVGRGLGLRVEGVAHASPAIVLNQLLDRLVRGVGSGAR